MGSQLQEASIVDTSDSASSQHGRRARQPSLGLDRDPTLQSTSQDSSRSTHMDNSKNDQGCGDVAEQAQTPGARQALDGGRAVSSRSLRRDTAHSEGFPDLRDPPTLVNMEIQPSQDPLHRRRYILCMCRALMTFGAPTHRLEMYMHSTANVLDLSIQSFHLPGCMILAFDDNASSAPDVQIVRCSQSLNLAKLYKIHRIYKAVIHREMRVHDALLRLQEINSEEGKFPLWFRILNYGLASAFVGPISYGARPVDLPLIFVLGALVGLLELVISPKSELYGYIFEISSAIMVSFIGRALGSIPNGDQSIFCFSAVAQASIVLILPGFTFTTSALEIQTGNMVSGSVRMVYGIIYTLFLAFGFTIGITIYGAMDSNSTSATHCRDVWPFWWQVTFVLPFTLCFVIVNQGNWKDMPGMLFVTLSGWVVNHFSSQRFTSIPALGQALGALTVGILANLMSRLGHGFAVAILHPAIYIQVPGSLAASGSLISGITSADQLTQSAGAVNQTGVGSPRAAVLDAGYTAVEIAIGITVGLSVGAFVVYPFRKTRGKSGIFSF